jgi:quercetin dioxygenase-like cupin family protein
MRTPAIAATSLLLMAGISGAASPNIAAGTHSGDLAAIMSLLPADHPEGTKATVNLVSLKRAQYLHEPILATFIVDYAPGGSAVLHRSPAAGYVLVHVLSGAIQAQAWDAGMGVYHTGETWVEPAFADNITSKNASAAEPAQALVILVTSDGDPSGPDDE